MHRIGSLIFVTCLVIGLTLTALGLSYSDAFQSNQLLEVVHNDVREIFNERMLNAEDSLSLGAQQMAGDALLVRELAETRQRLISTAPEELKRQTNNLWNVRIFDRLLALRQMQVSKFDQLGALFGERVKADSGQARTLYPKAAWWQRGPDLILAFANVPLKDGDISSTLVAYASEGKQLRAGKRYDEEIAALRKIQEDQTQKFTLFAWDGKMYIAVLEPVIHEDVNIASLVIGMELSRELVESFSRSLSKGIQLMAYYAKPKLGSAGDKSPLRRYYAILSEADRVLIENATYALYNPADDVKIERSLDQLEVGEIYVGKVGDKHMTFSRQRWLWDEDQEAGFCFMTDLDASKQHLDDFRSAIMMAGILFWLIAMVGVLVLIHLGQRDANRMKSALLVAINSGKPIDPEALSLLPGMRGLNISQYSIQVVDDPSDNAQENWESLMMNVEDEPNVESQVQSNVSDFILASDAVDEAEAGELYTEYMRLRAQLGITQPMDFDKFLRRLRRNAQKIKEQYKADKVSFEVHINNGKVVLKPKIETPQ